MRRNFVDHGSEKGGYVRAEAAFSLLEVMVCMVVIIVAITVFLAVLAQNVQLEAMNGETNIALSAAEEVIEHARTLSYGDVGYTLIPATFGASDLTNDGHTLTLTNLAGSTQVGQVTITENAGGTCKTVTARVVWRGATGREHWVMLMMEVTNY